MLDLKENVLLALPTLCKYGIWFFLSYITCLGSFERISFTVSVLQLTLNPHLCMLNLQTSNQMLLENLSGILDIYRLVFDGVGPIARSDKFDDESTTWIIGGRYDNMDLVLFIFSTCPFGYRYIFSDNRSTRLGNIITDLISSVIELSLWILTHSFKCLPTWVYTFSVEFISTDKSIKVEVKTNLLFLR